ncbi:MAG: hypothetical protein P8078_04710 [bacterium]
MISIHYLKKTILLITVCFDVSLSQNIINNSPLIPNLSLKSNDYLFKSSNHTLPFYNDTIQVTPDTSSPVDPHITVIKQDTVTVAKQTSQNMPKNPHISFSSSLIYSASSNIKDDYLFPGFNMDAEVIYSIPWYSDSLGFGFKTGFSVIKFDDNFPLSKLTFLNLHLLFLNSWGTLYNCPVLFQPYMGYTLFFGKNISDKIFFSYGGRMNFRLPSLGKFSIVIDGQMINTKFKDGPFGGTLGIIFLGVNYRL